MMMSRSDFMRLGVAATMLPPLQLVSSNAARSDEPLPIRVATATSDSYGQAYYAKDGGFFQRAGLNATIATYGNGSQSLAALSSGDADVALTNPVSLVQAIQKGLPFTCIAGSCLYITSAPTTALFVAKDSSFRSAKDLEGQTIALGSLKDLVTAALDTWLIGNHADLSKVRIIELPFPEMAPALKRGTVAAASIPEPFISANKGELRLMARHFDSISSSFYIDVWATTTAFAAKDTNAIKRFTDAIYATARWANANHDKTAPILAKYAKVEPSVIAAMTRATYATRFQTADLQPELDASFKYRLFDAPQRAEQIFSGG
jgi:NitT/TauT family transport system substrate-binding protein